MLKRKVAGVSPITSSHEKEKPPMMGGIQLQAHVDIRRPPQVCYHYWRDFTHLPRFMQHVQSVTVLDDDRRSHWMIDGPGDTTVEWDAELIEDLPNERISWRSVDKAQIDHAGSVQFESIHGGQGTRVKVALTYNPALGRIGELLIHLFGESPEDQLSDDLSRFKKMIEKSLPVGRRGG